MNQEYKMKKIMFQHKFWLFLVIAATFVYAGSELLKAYVLQVVLDAATLKSMVLFQKALLFTLIYIGSLLIVYVCFDFCKSAFVKRCMISVKAQWFADLQKKELCDYDVNDSAVYISHFTVDAATIEEDYLRNFLMVTEYLIAGIASLGVILSVHYSFALFIFATFWLPVFISHLWAERLAKLKMAVSNANGVFTAALKEMLSGFEIGKFFGLFSHMKGNFEARNVETEHKKFLSYFTSDVAEDCSGVSSMGIFFGNFLLGAYLTICGITTIGEVMKATQLMNNVLNPLYIVSSRMTRMKAADKIYKEVSLKLALGTEAAEEEKLALDAFSEGIRLQQVNLRQKERIILDRVDLLLQKDKKYLLTGESGSGKSSLLKILLNSYSNYTGDVWVDGKNLKNLNKDKLYSIMSVVTQDSFVFHDTLFNNIALFQSRSDEEIQRVVELCGLTEFVNSHEEGLAFVIEENGKNISGGERQRICLARALIRRPAILVLDEATSALNTELAFQIEKNILELEHTTVLAVSHRIFPELEARYDSVLRFADHTVRELKALEDR